MADNDTDTKTEGKRKGDAGTVDMKINRAYWMHNEVRVGDYVFRGDEVVAVAAKDVEAVKDFKSPDGRQYIVEA